MATFKRRLIRERVLQALYAYDMSKEPISEVMSTVFEELKSSKEDFDFAAHLVHEVIQHESELEKYIVAKVAHWDFDRIALIDRVLLRMGICEFLYFPDIPPKVTINELIEIAKTFSTDKSSQFVNGILDAILEDLKVSHTLKKTGRGLVEEATHHYETKSPEHQKPTKKK